MRERESSRVDDHDDDDDHFVCHFLCRGEVRKCYWHGARLKGGPPHLTSRFRSLLGEAIEIKATVIIYMTVKLTLASTLSLSVMMMMMMSKL